jgi:hypothetical protein
MSFPIQTQAAQVAQLAAAQHPNPALVNESVIKTIDIALKTALASEADKRALENGIFVKNQEAMLEGIKEILTILKTPKTKATKTAAAAVAVPVPGSEAPAASGSAVASVANVVIATPAPKSSKTKAPTFTTEEKDAFRKWLFIDPALSTTFTPLIEEGKLKSAMYKSRKAEDAKNNALADYVMSRVKTDASLVELIKKVAASKKSPIIPAQLTIGGIQSVIAGGQTKNVEQEEHSGDEEETLP